MTRGWLQGRRSLWKHLAVALLGTAGAGLLMAGLQQPKYAEPDGWVQMNGRLSAIIEASNHTQSGETMNKLPGTAGDAAQDDARQGDPGADKSSVSLSTGEAGTASLQGGGGARASTGAGQANSGAEADLDGSRLDINRANEEQLQTLPGIGPAKAKAIIEERSRNGLFKSVDDLQRVKGIGPKTVQKWKGLAVAMP